MIPDLTASRPLIWSNFTIRLFEDRRAARMAMHQLQCHPDEIAAAQKQRVMMLRIGAAYIR